MPLFTAFSTSVSALCVSGMVAVDTGTLTFGQVTIMLLFQTGGFGMITATTYLA